jgi:hypothetical protein
LHEDVRELERQLVQRINTASPTPIHPRREAGAPPICSSSFRSKYTLVFPG